MNNKVFRGVKTEMLEKKFHAELKKMNIEEECICEIVFTDMKDPRYIFMTECCGYRNNNFSGQCMYVIDDRLSMRICNHPKREKFMQETCLLVAMERI